MSKPRKSKSVWQNGTREFQSVTLHISRQEFSLKHLAATTQLRRMRSLLLRGLSIILEDMLSSVFCNSEWFMFFNSSKAAGDQAYKSMGTFSDIGHECSKRHVRKLCSGLKKIFCLFHVCFLWGILKTGPRIILN